MVLIQILAKVMPRPIWHIFGTNKDVVLLLKKFIQTGNPEGYSEDIELHRRLMGMEYLPEDEQGLTKPEIFSYPASPHLASRIDNRAIDFDKIKHATEVLSERYDAVLVEGAGGADGAVDRR